MRSPDHTGRNRRRFTVRRLISTILTGALSLIVVVLAGAYVIAPTRMALAVEVQADAGTHVSARQVVIYGKAVDFRGRSLKGVRVLIKQKNRTKLATTSRRDGTFRVVGRLASGSYIVTVVRRAKGKTTTVKVKARFKRGHAYRVSVKLVRTGGLSLVPIHSY